MNEQKKVNTINLLLDIVMLLSVFFAGILLQSSPYSYSPEFLLSLFLFVGGIFLSQVRAVPNEIGESDE